MNSGTVGVAFGGVEGVVEGVLKGKEETVDFMAIIAPGPPLSGLRVDTQDAAM